MGLWKIDLVKLAWYRFYEITSLVEKGNSTDVMYLDFCKAFDLVPPDFLIKKGECYKIIAANINWIKKKIANWYISICNCKRGKFIEQVCLHWSPAENGSGSKAV